MGEKLSQSQLHSEFGEILRRLHPPWARHHPGGMLTMYSMLEAGGYT